MTEANFSGAAIDKFRASNHVAVSLQASDNIWICKLSNLGN